MEEAAVFLSGAEAHDAFHASTVVPRAIENHDFAGGRQLFDVALEVPLTLLARVRSRQSFHAACTRIEVLGNALNGRALASGVAPFHDDDDAGTRLHYPLLHLHELRLQAYQFSLVGLLIQLRRLGVLLGGAVLGDFG